MLQKIKLTAVNMMKDRTNLQNIFFLRPLQALITYLKKLKLIINKIKIKNFIIPRMLLCRRKLIPPVNKWIIRLKNISFVFMKRAVQNP